MPDLDTPLHLEMYRRYRRTHTWRERLRRAVQSFARELFSPPLYGLQWGDPEQVPPLRHIRDQWVLPYVHPGHVGLEIGPGGGRWTRYLLGFRTLYLVDYHAEILAEARRVFARHRQVVVIHNHGHDFPGVPENSVNYVFSFGTFVHLELPIIEAYLTSLWGILAPGANVVLQYADQTKIMAQRNHGFAHTVPAQVRAAVRAAGYEILEEDLTTLWHSSVIRFRPPAAAILGEGKGVSPP